MDKIKGSVSIYPNGKRESYKSIYSSMEWFNGAEYFEIEIDEYCLIIKKCYMHIPKNASKAVRCKKQSKAVELNFSSYETPLGVFNIDNGFGFNFNIE